MLSNESTVALGYFRWGTLRTTGARAVAVPLLAIALTGCAAGAERLCVEVAAGVGLEFDNPYGRVLAEEEMGKIMQRNMGNGAAVGDYNNNGALDVYLLSNEGSPARLFRNELAETGEARFTDVTAEAGVDDHGLGRAAHFVDLNGSGWLDLVVVNDYIPGELPPSRIFANQGDGTFEDVSDGSGFAPEGYLVGGVTLADFTQNGFLDIYVSYWTREIGGSPIGAPIKGAWPGENRLYENLGDFRFRDITEEVGLGGVSMDTFTAIAHDFEGDGRFDLYLAVDHRSDRYYRNEGGVFVDASSEARVGHRGNSMGVAVADVDGSGWFDLFVSNIYDPQQSYGVDPPGNILLISEHTDEGIRFVNQADERGVLESGWGWGAAFVDIDLNTHQDLMTVQGFDEFIAEHFELRNMTSTLFRNDGTGHFQPAVDSGCEVPGDQRSLIVFDYNRSGAPDFLITQVDGPVLLLENQSSGNSITVRLDPSDAASVGAVVEAHTTETVMRRLVLAGASYLAGPPLEAYFGLGDAEIADIWVQWPTGDEATYSGIEAGTILDVSRHR